MDELILQPNESIILTPGEGLLAGTRPLRIRSWQQNAFEQMERTLWAMSKREHGNPMATYRRGEEFRLVCVVPERKLPDTFEFENHSLTTTIRPFKVQKADLLGWLPKSGDTLEYDGKTYTVQKNGNLKTFYEDVGNYEVVIRIFCTEPRS